MTRSDLKQERSFFRGSVSSFLQLVVAFSRGLFLESPDSQRARLAVSVYFKDRGFNSFASNMIKLSVNETKWSSLLAWTRGLILYISI